MLVLKGVWVLERGDTRRGRGGGMHVGEGARERVVTPERGIARGGGGGCERGVAREGVSRGGDCKRGGCRERVAREGCFKKGVFQEKVSMGRGQNSIVETTEYR